MLKQIFRSLKDSVTTPGGSIGTGPPHKLEGVFRQLIDPHEFRRRVLLSLPDYKEVGVPSTFQVEILIIAAVLVRYRRLCLCFEKATGLIRFFFGVVETKQRSFLVHSMFLLWWACSMWTSKYVLTDSGCIKSLLSVHE